MATSRSVAAIVSRSSDAVSFTHWRTGLGVRAATTLPVTVNASSRAPRLQITFMVRQPFLSNRTTTVLPSGRLVRFLFSPERLPDRAAFPCTVTPSGTGLRTGVRQAPVRRAGTLTLLLYETKLQYSSSRDEAWRILDNSGVR